MQYLIAAISYSLAPVVLILSFATFIPTNDYIKTMDVQEEVNLGIMEKQDQ